LLSRSGSSVNAFNPTCPHQGCTVNPSGSTLTCPCHGSKFNASDGGLINGPATRGLTGVSVSVVNGWVVP
jgi:Rieske Fe-S protein